MSLLERVRTPDGSGQPGASGLPGRSGSTVRSRSERERRWSAGRGPQRRPSRALLLALVLASTSLMVLDRTGGEDSPLEPARRVVGEALGPVETGATAVVRPFASIPEWFRTQGSLRDDLDALEAENSLLRGELATAGLDANRLAEYDGLTRTAEDLGHTLVPARVVGVGPAQSFSSTVTLDAGSQAGLAPDMTVVNNDGLVGRVLRVTSTTATVVLVIDSESTVGARAGESMEVGFLRGRGSFGDGGRLDLELVDDQSVPARDDNVVTWGSDAGAPYLSGIPVGRVTQVYSSLRDTSQRAVVEPFVDFSSLDLVGVIVPAGTDSDRAVIDAEGELR
ncbi:rod shape-determining protein MreC [Nocardioides kribbensis]|uniref:Cell shape-determining protein MreC n=2 Tax=Nocardioides kribbensis TaxID=305517 RepID=A0ABV1NZQ1_9ACTN|nr:rod shape-determining protein MreC [Nocardioides kribbensis]